MQFTNNLITELIIPSGTPFAPGNDVIGIGTELPNELVTSNIKAAIVWYFSNWNPAATTPQVKFMYIGTAIIPGEAGIAMGFGVVANASVSQVATLMHGFNFLATNSFTGHLAAEMAIYNHNNNIIMQAGEADAAGDGQLATYNDGAYPTQSGHVP